MDNKGKEGSYTLLFVMMFISMLIALFWDSVPAIKDSAHALLNPSAGLLLDWNLNFGFVILILIITLITTLFQKYTTDQETIRDMKKQQKEMNMEMKKLEAGSQKYMEMQKKQLELLPKMFKLNIRPMIFTAIPLILLFRWFMDFFNVLNNPKFFNFFSWFWYYLILSIIFSTILRKILKVE
ncbi:EMC3/TMCO1 family protein [Candidatus Pacearchaeota archaeon]|nr:EMC3/TMCO1 family protein [Candidatus Pacearchaeota archaeon]